jgi:hypothetical protein
MHSARGRWFLDEFARRNRSADTMVLLDAIGRIEAVIRDERSREAFQSFRIDLLEMAKAIAETRAEVAGIKPEAPPQGKLPAQSTEAAAPASSIFAAAERIQDVVWAMRERGLDPALCEQIESLATIILSASSLRDPNDPRAQKLAVVLLLLERRINAMLADVAVADQRTQTPLEAHAPPQTEERSPPAGNGHDPDAIQAAAAETVAAQEPPPHESETAPPVSIKAERQELARDPPAELQLEPTTVAQQPRFAADPAPATPAAEPGERLPEQGALVLQPAAGDSLAALQVLSDEERIALFT